MNVSHNFTQRRESVALVVFVLGMIAVALVAFLASDLVGFFTAASASATPDFVPAPIVPTP
jgi:hypothetical protein